MLFGKKRRQFERERDEYLSCESVWYFDVEYYEDWSNHPTHMKFESLRAAEYWVKTSNCVSGIVCVTDRHGNRIVTDWTGYAGAGTMKVWTQAMKRCVLDLREGCNTIWVPDTDRRAKNANKILT